MDVIKLAPTCLVATVAAVGVAILWTETELLAMVHNEATNLQMSIKS